jgi:hypothetical protein
VRLVVGAGVRLVVGTGVRLAVGTGLGVVVLALAACGGSSRAPQPTGRLPADYVPLPPGQGPRFHPPAISPSVAARRPIAGLTCGRGAGAGDGVFGIHLELYANHRVLPVPAGIGIAPPQQRQGAYVRAGACVYPVRTYEPTGVVAVDATRPNPLTLRALFAVWGQPLGATRLAGFRGRVRAFLGGRRWLGDPRRIPLTRHAEIVLEVGPAVPPHRTYLFPPGL